jgi:hypothetical protein
MQRLVLAFAVCALCSSPVLAQDKKAMTPQQQRMAECSTKAKGLKGNEYKKARNDCLKGNDGAKDAKRGGQQQKMAECNARAKGLKGDAFTKARNDCLKG